MRRRRRRALLPQVRPARWGSPRRGPTGRAARIGSDRRICRYRGPPRPGCRCRGCRPDARSRRDRATDSPPRSRCGCASGRSTDSAIHRRPASCTDRRPWRTPPFRRRCRGARPFPSRRWLPRPPASSPGLYRRSTAACRSRRPYSPPLVPSRILPFTAVGAIVSLYPNSGSATSVDSAVLPVLASSATSFESSVARYTLSPYTATPRLFDPQQ